MFGRRAINSNAVCAHARCGTVRDHCSTRRFSLIALCLAVVCLVSLQAKLGSPALSASSCPRNAAAQHAPDGAPEWILSCTQERGSVGLLPYELRERIVRRHATVEGHQPAFVTHPEVTCLMRNADVQTFVTDRFRESPVLLSARIQSAPSDPLPAPCADSASFFVDLAVASYPTGGPLRPLGIRRDDGFTAGVLTLQLMFSPASCSGKTWTESGFLEPLLLVAGELDSSLYWRLHLYSFLASANASACGVAAVPKHPYTSRQFSVESVQKAKLQVFHTSTQSKAGVPLVDAFAHVLNEGKGKGQVGRAPVHFFPLQRPTRTALFGYLEYHFTYLRQLSQLHIPECHSGDELFVPLGGVVKLTYVLQSPGVTREFVAAGNRRDRMLFAPGSYDGQCVPHVATALSPAGSIHLVLRWASHRATSCDMSANNSSCLLPKQVAARFDSHPLFPELALAGAPFVTQTGNVASLEVHRVLLTGTLDVVAGSLQECFVLVMEGTATVRQGASGDAVNMQQWATAYLLPSSSLHIQAIGSVSLVIIKLQGYKA